MTDEEKLAIKDLKEYLNWEELQGFSKLPRDKHLETVLNLIEKQDKIIHDMANFIEKDDDAVEEFICPYCKYQDKECATAECIKEIIEYFEKEGK